MNIFCECLFILLQGLSFFFHWQKNSKSETIDNMYIAQTRAITRKIALFRTKHPWFSERLELHAATPVLGWHHPTTIGFEGVEDLLVPTLGWKGVHPRNLTNRYQQWLYFRGVHLFQGQSFLVSFRGCIFSCNVYRFFF